MGFVHLTEISVFSDSELGDIANQFSKLDKSEWRGLEARGLVREQYQGHLALEKSGWLYLMVARTQHEAGTTLTYIATTEHDDNRMADTADGLVRLDYGPVDTVQGGPKALLRGVKSHLPTRGRPQHAQTSPPDHVNLMAWHTDPALLGDTIIQALDVAPVTPVRTYEPADAPGFVHNALLAAGFQHGREGTFQTQNHLMQNRIEYIYH